MKNKIDDNIYQAVIDHYSAKISEAKMHLNSIFNTPSKHKMDNIDNWLGKLAEADDRLGSFRQFFDSNTNASTEVYDNFISTAKKSEVDDQELIQNKLHFLKMNCFTEDLKSKLQAIETFMYDLEHIVSLNKNDILLNKMIQLEDHIFDAEKLIESASKQYNLINLQLKNFDIDNVKSHLDVYNDKGIMRYGMLGDNGIDVNTKNVAFSLKNLKIDADEKFIIGDIKFLSNQQGYDAATMVLNNNLMFEMSFNGIEEINTTKFSKTPIIKRINHFYAVEKNSLPLPC